MHHDHPYLRKPHGPLVFAHRGGGGLAPENTLPAFEQAVAMGVDGLELDIHATRDGVLVVAHDATVERMTDGQGAIADMTVAALQRLDAGYHWTADGGRTFPFRGTGLYLPTLEEMFARFGRTRINIDIKQRRPSIVRPFVDLIRRYGMAENVLVGSFHGDTLAEFRRACPEVITAGSMAEVRRFFILNKLRLPWLYRGRAQAFQLPEYSDDTHVVTPRFVRNVQRRGVQVHVWTVNAVDDMRRLLEWGVDGIITDYPDRLMALLGRQ